ncbi:MAG: DJ-1/PfpI family protein, partial [Clostridiales bacterium]|nr:DJ-1/PfpI family protein [Clostridiales bacterium]
MSTTTENILFVLLDKWADWEFAYAAAAVNEFGAGRFVNVAVSTDLDPKKSIGGLNCLPDFDLDRAMTTDYAALILIGGMSWRGEHAKRVVPLVKRCVADGKPLGAICDACRFLAGIGMLNNVKHTGNGMDELTAAGENYSNQDGFLYKQAVRDNGVITANGTA